MEPASATVVPLALFVMITVTTGGLIWLAYKSGLERHQTVRKAMELGQPLDAATLRALSRNPSTPEGDLRGGVIASCVGIAFLAVAGANAATTTGLTDGTRIAAFLGILALGLGGGRLLASRLLPKNED
jgi:hypothetical protein